MTTKFLPGTYVKGDKTRRALNARDAVAAVFDGYVLHDEGFDPNSKTVTEVIDHLEASDEPEVARVKELESQGKARKTILEFDQTQES